MPNVLRFIPNDPAPSDAETTVYNVFIGDLFTGYITKDWMDYWWYYSNGEKAGQGHADRCALFNTLAEQLT